MDKKLQQKFKKPLFSIINSLPIMLAVIFALGLFKTVISFDQFSKVFTGIAWIDTLLGSLMGSIFAGNSINSYIIGEEMMTAGISMFAITAFLVSWVTVGLMQAPVEIENFGKKFTYLRNLISAILAVFVSLITVTIMGVI